MTLLSLHGRGTGAEGSTGYVNLGFRRSDVVFVLDVEQWTSSTPSAGSSRVCGSLPIGSTCV